MRAFRIVLRRYGKTAREAFGGLSGHAASGRWHTSGRHLDYAAESLSLATLERLVHYKRFDCLAPHVLYVLEVPDARIESVLSLPAGWDGDDPLPVAQAIGDRWCDGAQSPALQAPSAITSGESNLLLNSHHPEWDWRWVTTGPTPFQFDSRLVELMKRPGA